MKSERWICATDEKVGIILVSSLRGSLVSTKGPKKTPGRETGIETLERVSTKKPRKFQVVMHNDDYTTQEFVVHILQAYFRKDPTEASHLMIKVHTTGQAIVGCYTRDVAETKVEVVTGYARDNGMPLMITSEPEP